MVLHPSQVGPHLAAVARSISERINAECEAAADAHPSEVERGMSEYRSGNKAHLSFIHSPEDGPKKIAYEHGRCLASWDDTVGKKK